MTTPTYPSLVSRLIATTADSLVILACCIAVAFGLASDSPTISNIKIAIILMIFFLYDPILTSTTATLGQKMMGIRVVDQEKQCSISFPRALVRFIVKYFLGAISVFVVPLNKKKAAIHDMVVRSVMIDVSQE